MPLVRGALPTAYVLSVNQIVIQPIVNATKQGLIMVISLMGVQNMGVKKG